MKATKLSHGKFYVIGEKILPKHFNTGNPARDAFLRDKYPPVVRDWDKSPEAAIARAAERLDKPEEQHRDELYIMQVVRVVKRKALPVKQLPVTVSRVK